MNYLLTLVFVLILQCESMAQNDHIPYAQLESLKSRSRSQKIAGFAVLGAGAIITVAGVVKSNTDSYIRSLEDVKNKQATTAIIIGSIVTLASVPLFALSYSNSKKANSIEFKNQAVSYLRFNKGSVISQPAIALKISF